MICEIEKDETFYSNFSDNYYFDNLVATVRHILVESIEEAEMIKDRIIKGEKFEDMAKYFSKCSSGMNGGVIESVKPGTMISEFEEVIFEEKLNFLHGPVKTAFGYHLIEILNRFEEEVVL